MSKIISILKEINPEYNYEDSTNFLEDNLLDSLTLITLISEIENICKIEIDVVDIDEDDLIDENSIINMVKRFKGNTSLLN